MAKMILGNTGTTVMPAVVVDKAPRYYIERKALSNGVLSSAGVTNMIDLTGITQIDTGALAFAYYGNSDSYITHITSLPDFSNITRIYPYGCYRAFYRTSVNTSINLSSCTRFDGYACADAFRESDITGIDLSGFIDASDATGNNRFDNMCRGCASLTSINIAVEKLGGQYSFNSAFEGCNALTSVNLSSIIIIGAYNACSNMFSGCSNLSSIDISRLVAAEGNSCMESMFYRCKFTTFKFDSLKKIDGMWALQGIFQYNPLTDLYFPALATANGSWAFNNVLNGITGCTVHLPSNYTGQASFGGTNTTVLHDLPSTAHLIGDNTTEYERNPKYDTVNVLAWRVKDTGSGLNTVVDWTPYYTSGTTDPSVGDTIYSDASCTTAVTTISTIS